MVCESQVLPRTKLGKLHSRLPPCCRTHISRGKMNPKHPEHGLGVFFQRIKMGYSFMSLSQEKWDKIKHLFWTKGSCWGWSQLIQWEYYARSWSKFLEQVLGIFQYLSHKDPGINPDIIIGFHLTINKWQENRDTKGVRERLTSWSPTWSESTCRRISISLPHGSGIFGGSASLTSP